MAWRNIGNIRGPAGPTGPQGPQGPAATASEAFLAAHPVGSLYAETTGRDPGKDHGGKWSMQDSVNGFLWLREE